MAQGTWILEKCASERFPYRLQILREDKPWITLRTQDRWPAAGKRIFCLREDQPLVPDELIQEIERVDIVAFHERGRRISVVHQKLAELATYHNHALVIEAAYADFLNPKKVHHYTVGFCAKAIAELYVRISE